MSPSDTVLAIMLTALSFAAGGANAYAPSRWRSLAGVVTFISGILIGVFLVMSTIAMRY